MSIDFAGIGEARLAGIGKASEAIAGNPGKGNKFDESFGNIVIDTEPSDPFSNFLQLKMDQVAGNRQGPK